MAAIIPAALALSQVSPDATPPKFAWSDQHLSPDRRADLVIEQMTIDEKIKLVHGAGLLDFGPASPDLVRSNGGGGLVSGIPRLGIPDLNMDDSSMGVGGGARKGRYSTALPSTLALASSWNPALANQYGSLIGRELGDQGYNVSLVGGVDIAREPRNGRNFEYQGEDPILAGNMVAQLIRGIQSQGIIGDVKHYAVNDTETGRYYSNSKMDERSMREGDLLAFEIAVKKAAPGMVMCSYNLINGVYACENEYTLNTVLKKEWGFKGWVISDWLGTHSTEKSALAGLDQEQPGETFFGEKLKTAVEVGSVPMGRLNDMVHRILRTEFASGIIDNPRATAVPDIFKGLEVAQRVEEQSAVLLKNSNGVLPLRAAGLKSIAVIGSHADVGVLSGGGSAQVDPAGGNAVPVTTKAGDLEALLTTPHWHRSPPLAAIRKHAPEAEVVFNSGDDPNAAAAVAQNADVAIVFVSKFMHEGNDAPTLGLPGTQDELVRAVAAKNKRTIVVLETGGAVVMPWVNDVGGIVEAWYPGIRGGEAIANILFGDVNPSGKLAVTFPRSDEDLPHPKLPTPPGDTPGPLEGIGLDPNAAPKTPFDVEYTEGLKAGYKWFDAMSKEPLFPFGYGLSYTSYTFANARAEFAQGLHVRFDVTNTGKRAGAEVAQVYLSFPKQAGEPPKRLVGWQRVELAPGETKAVAIEVEPLYLSIFDVQVKHWTIVPGDYEIRIGGSSRDLPLSATIRMQ